ncbi:hypothetical protein B0T21DRAFT_179046 [Apiosordaria backusii]|uniref:Secreted protein n=1 Tax=Apiosordaria backusii TaxID=314023 RepID=A0AA40EG58_9PEZI|nr:hypothetical protein B0T21DRAFT_179046 [Apiosordaria backusii]
MNRRRPHVILALLFLFFLRGFPTPPFLPHTRMGERIICFCVERFAGTRPEQQGQFSHVGVSLGTAGQSHGTHI